MRVIGTAGHVDHGKSTLVEALTGIHPDRLKEEQAREMTIDLGFAWMRLPGFDQEIGVVDVPGHRDFIENMLAGVGGIDAVIFVVAADEGVMPQTREHLAILDLLEIPAGLVALTKADLVDAEWLELVREDVKQALRGTVLENAPILAVSVRNGQGLEELKNSLGQILASCPARLDNRRPRLPVDRIFTIAGFGTVVTGTLVDGQFQLGDEVQVLPNLNVRGRVRGLQSHKNRVERAIQGSRVAINISGVDVAEIKRGNVIAWPGTYQPTKRIDVFFRMLSDVRIPLKHGIEVKFFLGAAEVKARARLLGVEGAGLEERTTAGEENWLQLELDEPVVAVRGDRYILRLPSPGETLGGGEVVDPFPQRRHKRFNSQVLSNLRALRRGTPVELLIQSWMKLGPASLLEGMAASRLSDQEAREALLEGITSGALVVIEPDVDLSDPKLGQMDLLAIPAVLWRGLVQTGLEILGRYHTQNPLRRGMPREEFKSRLKLTTRIFNPVMRKMIYEKTITEAGVFVALPDHAISFSPAQQTKVDRLLAALKASPFTPPNVKECQVIAGEDVYAALVELGEVVQVSEDVAFRKADFEIMLEKVKTHFKAEPTLTVAQFRDQFNTTRRYALAFLEHLDAQRLTVRDGDVRRWNSGESGNSRVIS